MYVLLPLDEDDLKRLAKKDCKCLGVGRSGYLQTLGKTKPVICKCVKQGLLAVKAELEERRKRRNGDKSGLGAATG